MTIHTPVHVGVVAGKPLRFFRSPKPGPQMPWHAHDDLLSCLDLPDDLKLDFRRRLVGPWKADVRTVAVAEGVVTIAPHFIAQGLIGAAIEIGPVKSAKQVERDYHREGTIALELLAKAATGDLGPIAQFEYAMAAAKNPRA